MYSKIHNIFRIILIEFIVLVLITGALQRVEALQTNYVFLSVTLALIWVNLTVCVLFILFYLIAGIILLVKVIVREKSSFIKTKLLEMAVIWAIVSVIACIFKFNSTTYLGMAGWCVIFTFIDVVKNEMKKADELRKKNI